MGEVGPATGTEQLFAAPLSTLNHLLDCARAVVVSVQFELSSDHSGPEVGGAVDDEWGGDTARLMTRTHGKWFLL